MIMEHDDYQRIRQYDEQADKNQSELFEFDMDNTTQTQTTTDETHKPHMTINTDDFWTLDEIGRTVVMATAAEHNSDINEGDL